MNKAALHYPTYTSYREAAGRDDLAGLGESITFYRERLAGCGSREIKQCYTDALREYEPGDMIDFYS